MIHQMKYSQQIHLVRIFAKELLKRLKCFHKNQNLQIDCLIPIPASNRNLWQRKFDQSTEITRIISKHLNIPYQHIFKNIHHTGYTNQNRKYRKQNKRFNLKYPNMCFKHIVLVDDVITTGNTIEQAAYLIKKHNIAQKISAWSIARTNLN